MAKQLHLVPEYSTKHVIDYRYEIESAAGNLTLPIPSLRHNTYDAAARRAAATWLTKEWLSRIYNPDSICFSRILWDIREIYKGTANWSHICKDHTYDFHWTIRERDVKFLDLSKES